MLQCWYYCWQTFVKYAVEMTSGVMMCMSNFIKLVSGPHKHTHAHTAWWSHKFIPIFQNKESRLKMSTLFKPYILKSCRSQWPFGLRHEPFSPARTQRSWVPIPLKAWMSVCVYSMFVLSCVQVVTLRRADPPSKEYYRLCIGLRNWKSGQGPKGCRAIDREREYLTPTPPIGLCVYILLHVHV
jgi:hypothetical protein